MTDEEFKKALEKCSESDFDGHTEFHKLTPEERIDWLASMQLFYLELHGAENYIKKTCPNEYKTIYD